MALLFKRWLAKSFPSDKLLDSLQLRPIVKQKERLAEIKSKVFKVENSSSSPASPQQHLDCEEVKNVRRRRREGKSRSSVNSSAEIHWCVSAFLHIHICTYTYTYTYTNLSNSNKSVKIPQISKQIDTFVKFCKI